MGGHSLLANGLIIRKRSSMIPATPPRLGLLPILALSAVAVAQGPGGPGGPGGGRGPRNTTTKVVEQFDRDGNGRLNREERVAAKVWIAARIERSKDDGEKKRGREEQVTSETCETLCGAPGSAESDGEG